MVNVNISILFWEDRNPTLWKTEIILKLKFSKFWTFWSQHICFCGQLIDHSIPIVPLAIYLFLYSYETGFIQRLLQIKYTVVSLNNAMFGYYLDRIYYNGLEVKVTTEKLRFASYLDHYLIIDGGDWKANYTINEINSTFLQYKNIDIEFIALDAFLE